MGKRLYKVSCAGCGKSFDSVFMPFCDACGEITEVSYDLDRVRLHDSNNPYERFRDLLPVADSALLPGEYEYTPAVHAQKLGAELGMPNLYLKDESRLPTGTTKDRMAAVSLAYLYECGVRTFCTSSTGNSSTSYARAIDNFEDFNMYLFTAEAFRHRVQYAYSDRITHFVMRDASFVEAFNYSGEFAGYNGFVSERGFFNLGRREGLKLAWFEALDQIERPIDWYVQAVSSAMGVYGTYKGASEMVQLGKAARTPRVLCVQQETCSPMVQAWREGSDKILPHHKALNPRGIAEAILRGDPTRAYPHVRRIAIESRGDFESVSETEIREARRMVEELEGLTPCFSASTAVAGLIKQIRRGIFPAEDTVLVNLTGSDRPRDEIAPNRAEEVLLVKTAGCWTPQNPQHAENLRFNAPSPATVA
jgi:threonine synthase